jgi:glycine dehydrogenase
LAPYLPGHIDHGSTHPVSAAPYGSASILPITWMYIRMMGADGLKRATEQAILAANYVATRLKDHYPVLYKGRGDRVAHECILDTRVLKDIAGITVDDIAKRLIDYGFHAPTMSWPVAGTLMVEPTESEPKHELDRFCDAMILIAKEAARVASGEWPKTDNPLLNAPHTATETLVEEWTHPYSRIEAAYPASNPDNSAKYWPPVSRIDNVAGDRNLVCSCPPLSAYSDAAE